MNSCSRCKFSFPQKFLNDYERLHLTPLCPMCAVFLLSRLERKEIPSNELYDEARKYKKDHSKQNVGGYMIDPPKMCDFLKRSTDGLNWVDFSICETACEGKCKRYLDVSLMSTKEYINELHKYGVVY